MVRPPGARHCPLSPTPVSARNADSTRVSSAQKTGAVERDFAAVRVRGDQFAVAEVASLVEMRPGVIGEYVAFGHTRAPVVAPTGIERAIAARGALVRQKESSRHGFLFQCAGDDVGLRHVAGIEGEVHVAIARPRRHRSECQAGDAQILNPDSYPLPRPPSLPSPASRGRVRAEARGGTREGANAAPHEFGNKARVASVRRGCCF